MELGFDPTDIVACAMRPTGSFGHLAALIGFVVAAWFVSRASGGAKHSSR